MNLEIERRFIVDLKALSENAELVDFLFIEQAYFETPYGTPTTRVRAIMNKDDAYQTTKIKQSVGTYKEYEYKIPYYDCLDIINALTMKLSKVRRVYKWVDSNGKEFLFEVDMFDGLGVVIAEVELESMESLTEIPAWCLREITNESGVSNYSIAENKEVAYEKLRELAVGV